MIFESNLAGRPVPDKLLLIKESLLSKGEFEVLRGLPRTKTILNNFKSSMRTMDLN